MLVGDTISARIYAAEFRQSEVMGQALGDSFLHDVRARSAGLLCDLATQPDAEHHGPAYRISGAQVVEQHGPGGAKADPGRGEAHRARDRRGRRCNWAQP